MGDDSADHLKQRCSDLKNENAEIKPEWNTLSSKICGKSVEEYAQVQSTLQEKLDFQRCLLVKAINSSSLEETASQIEKGIKGQELTVVDLSSPTACANFIKLIEEVKSKKPIAIDGKLDFQP